MMSGNLGWGGGNLGNRGTRGYIWASTPHTYTASRDLYFYSASVYPKNNDGKPNGFTLRRVARFLCAFPSRALRNLPLSVMVSGFLVWYSGYPSNRGTSGHFWASTPNSYTTSRDLYFYSTNVYPKYGGSKPYGFPLRCVAQQKIAPKSDFLFI